MPVDDHADVMVVLAVQYVSWSPDDRLLLTCGGDEDPTVRIWDMASGRCNKVIDRHTQVSFARIR